MPCSFLRSVTPRRGVRACACVLALLLPCTAAHGADALALDDALARAEQAAPMLAARHAGIAAAESRIGPAGELPDPQLVVSIDNLPIDGMDAGSLTADFMTMRKVGVMQTFVRADKRTLRQQRARADAERERALLASDRLAVREAVARAWIARHVAEQRRALLVALRARFDLQVAAASSRIAAGGASADALAARSARVELEDRISEAERDVAIAVADLAIWLPDAADAPLAAPPDWNDLGGVTASALVSNIDAHRELLAFAARERAAEVDVQLARADKRPDWSLELAYAERGALYSDMVSLMVRVDLPVFGGRRQDPLIAARQAERDQVAAEREDARRRHAAGLRAAIAAWTSARERVARFERELRPLSIDRADAALAAYRGGRGDLASVSAALAAQTERELDYVERLDELASAWATLRFAFAEEH